MSCINKELCFADVVYRSVCGWVMAHIVYALLLFPARLVRPLLGPLRAILPILDSTNRTIASVTSFTDQEDVTSGVFFVLYEMLNHIV